MSKSFDRGELLGLVDRLVSDLLTADEHRRLAQILVQDAAARRLYFDYLDLNPREVDDSTSLRIAFQQMNVPWPVRGGRAGMLEMPPRSTYRVRPLAKPLDLGKDAVYYISLLVREEQRPDRRSPSHPFESVRLTFRASQAYWGDRVALALSGDGKTHIELADFLRFTGLDGVPRGQTLLWVAKIIARRAGEDEAYFRVYQEGETFDLMEPGRWSVASRGFRSDARLDLVLLSSTGETRRWFDELRIGTSWRAVVPVARPTALPAAAAGSAGAEHEARATRAD